MESFKRVGGASILNEYVEVIFSNEPSFDCALKHIFLDCFQTLFRSAGMKGLKTVFLITDTQIKDEGFLEDIDSVLNTGEVPNLFAADEKQEVMEVSFTENS